MPDLRPLPFLLTFGFALAATDASAQIGQQPLLFTVGSDAACSHTTLAAALLAARNNAGHDFIHIARNHQDTQIAVDINGHEITIIGGFDTCGDITPLGQTTLDGAGGSVDSVIEIRNKPDADDGPDVVLRNLVIRGGENDAVSGDPGGGGVEISAGMDVRLENVTIRDNLSTRGGGIYVGGAGTSLVLAEGSIVGGGNSALLGGGIYCTGAFAGIFQSRVAGNRATEAAGGGEGDGGGVHATNGCLFRVGAGGVGDGVLTNDAEGVGGGIFATNGSRIDLRGDASGPARVATNQGTGIFAVGNGTRVLAENAHIVSNFGTGVALRERALLRMERTLSEDCHTVDRCSQLSGNSGTGLFLCTGIAELSGTYIEENSLAINANNFCGGGSLIEAEGLVVAGNGSSAISRPIDLRNSNTHFAFTTFADNGFADHLIRQTGGNLELYSSIVSESHVAIYQLVPDGVTSNTFDCLIVNDDLALPSTATRILELRDGPPFVDRANGDYHLLPGAAVDLCDESVYAPRSGDIDGDPRGVDHPSVDDAFAGSFWDAGADELSVLPDPRTYRLVPVTLATSGARFEGTITTDGALGPLSPTNLIDWSVEVSGPIEFTITPANSALNPTVFSMVSASESEVRVAFPDGVFQFNLIGPFTETVPECSSCFDNAVQLFRSDFGRNIQGLSLRDEDDAVPSIDDFQGPVVTGGDTLYLAAVPEAGGLQTLAACLGALGVLAGLRGRDR